MTNNVLRDGGVSASICKFELSHDQIVQDGFQPLSLDDDVSDALIREMGSQIPLSILHPERVQRKAEEFTAAFSGHVLYAVKCNPDPIFLHAMYEGGVRRFDVASIAEVRLIKGLFPDAKIYFMHPIKSQEAIREAYVNHGVRAFVLDYADELDKILHATNSAPDLELFVRMAIPKDNPDGGVATDFSSKFGAKPWLAEELLRLCRPHCAQLGLSFHVGTQCPDPKIYSKAVAHAAQVIEGSGVCVEVLDVGGGFPAQLDGAAPIPGVSAFTQTIAGTIAEHGLENLELLAEVGRGLVACGGSLVVRVEGRKDDLLYLNDGTYGGMFEAGSSIGLQYPARLIRREVQLEDAPLKAFRFAGPTCDSVDMMRGPFMLPADLKVGDWIKLDQLGAYGEVSRTDFNGFGQVQKIVVQADACCEDYVQIA